ncbi:helix-turn-helix domain-containing protein [Cyanobacterium aponinum]|uniref:helix-turn-helix domain-containing protein n=1 Tax=Cyanobacterium aponinum TaxID=379064 RepID=UPI000C12C50A|nr:AraC family transcriptional regulator [Cyanobacterium aponinum]PHV62054.1 AraC family transcriptional regulator [Cyanobacterium aponinum IPPAS B-1201]
MTISISTEEFKAIWQESIEKGEIKEYRSKTETITPFPPYLGTGFWWEIELRNGLTVLIQDYCYHQKIIEIDKVESSSQLVSSFYLKGGYTSTVDNLFLSREVTPKNNQLFLIKDTIEKDEIPANKPILAIKLIIDKEFLNHLCFESNHPLFQHLERWRKDQEIEPFLYNCQTSAHLETLLKQIIDCPYQGCLAQMYLESKIMDLLRLQFEQILTLEIEQKLSFNRDDIERIYQAKNILINNYKDPPSLINLARQVGLNDYKLKKGFLHCFQMTVFGYLRHYRLLEAQRLIKDYNYNIAGVASQVGYKSLGSFSSAFKAEFGVSPKQYQKQSSL